MIKSMTGFASLTREDDTTSLNVTIRAVNHRFLDLQVRAPQALAAIEARLRALVQQRIARGRIEVSIALQWRRPPVLDVQVNDEVVEALAGAFERARARGLVAGPLAPGDVLRFPQAVSVREREQDEAAERAAQALAEAALAGALEQLDGMRSQEGAALQVELDARRELLTDLFERAASAARAGAEALQARLADRIKELRVDPAVDDAVVAQELVKFANRSDVTEETVRFRAHIEHWKALMGGAEPCGRKLDFLIQEMNREVNTLGSKAEGPGVPELIVSLKAELEKMREQVQNVE
jgi:uncharacterized protein (TIGR00255 family)